MTILLLAIRAAAPLWMEDERIGQNFGYILYRIVVPASAAGQKLALSGQWEAGLN